MTDATVLPRPAHQPGCSSSIALVGFMGAGKTTVGRALAERLGWRFADLDSLIEAREQRTIPEIFDQDGEARFRELETLVLEKALAGGESDFLVVALGGGAFVTEGVRDILRNHGVPSVWLDAPVAELFQRCEQPDVARPLRRDPDRFARLYEQRLSSYRQADYHVITSGKGIADLVEEIITQTGVSRGRSTQ